MALSAPPTNVSHASSGSSQQATSIKIIKRPLSSIFHHKNYKFEGQFPQFVGSPTKTVDFLNKKVRDEISSAIPGEGDGITWDDAPVDPEKGLNSEWCDYELKFLTENFVSFALSTAHCLSGAPHAVSYVKCFNYRLTPQCKPILLGDLLGKKANYKVVSKMLKQTFKSSGRDVDTPRDFSVDMSDDRFVFDQNGIGWRFGDYAMGSYVGGARSGYLSYKQLKQLAMSGSIAANFLAKSP
jgi:hypothetical protein